VLAAGTFAQATYSAIWFGVAVMAPALRDRYHLSLGQTGILLGASLGGSVVTLVPWGMAADRLGERAVLITGVAACGIALLAAARVSGFWPLLGCLLVAGMTGASVQSASGRAVMAWFPQAQRGLALGIRQTAIPIGGFVVSLGLPPLVHHDSVRAGFAALGIACLCSTAVAGLVLREGPPDPEQGTAADSGPPPFRDRRVWSMALGSALIVAPQMCLVGFTVVFLHDARGVAAGAAAAVLASIQLLGIVGRIAAGRWSDLVASRIAPMRSIALATAILTLLTAVGVGAPLVVLIPVLVTAGALAMSWNGLAFAAAAEVSGRARSGVAIGLQQSVLNGIGAAYPPIFGALVAATTWRYGFAAVALLPLAGRRVLRALRV
jgi:sugar phosphate permease